MIEVLESSEKIKAASTKLATSSNQFAQEWDKQT